MKITHLAILTEKLEELKDFYVSYFKASAGEKYVNQHKQFASYFLTFQGETTLELMNVADLQTRPHAKPSKVNGLAHFALSLESRDAVDALTRRLQDDGYELASAPRTTGDGYYESAIFDPDGNMVELTC